MCSIAFEDVIVRKFCADDIANKVNWINDTENNTYLHYDLPLEYKKTLAWFENIKNSTSRFDGVIECSNVPVGLIGLLGIDNTNKKAEYYICLGNKDYKGKGIAKKASIAVLNYAFKDLGLERIYLYTEEENFAAQKLFERIGFQKEGFIRQDLIYNGRKVNRYIYGILKEDFYDKYGNSDT